MRKFLIIGAAVAALSTAAIVPAQAQSFDSDYDRGSRAGAFVGGTSGAWTGGTIGFLLGGPIGAVVGGWTGAATGAAIGASVLDDDVSFGGYADIEIDIDYRVGDYVDDGIRLRHIRGEDRYGYFRAHGQVYVVDLGTREVVEIRLG